MLMGLFHTNECVFPSHSTATGPGSLPESPLVKDRPLSALDGTPGQLPRFPADKAQGQLWEGIQSKIAIRMRLPEAWTAQRLWAFHSH